MNPKGDRDFDKNDVRNPRGKTYVTPALTVHGTVEQLTETGAGTAMDQTGLGSTV